MSGHNEYNCFICNNENAPVPGGEMFSPKFFVATHTEIYTRSSSKERTAKRKEQRQKDAQERLHPTSRRGSSSSSSNTIAGLIVIGDWLIEDYKEQEASGRKRTISKEI